MRKTTMSTGALLRHLRGLGLRVSERNLDYRLREGTLPEPPRTTSGQRAWEPEDVARAEAFFRERGVRHA